MELVLGIRHTWGPDLMEVAESVGNRTWDTRVAGRRSNQPIDTETPHGGHLFSECTKLH